MYNKQLITFIIVAESGSFTKASELLFLSPVSVMKQINSLEEHLNIRLLDRTPTGISLTEKGEKVFREAKKIISEGDEFLRELNRDYNDKVVVKLGLYKMDYLSDFPKKLRYINNESIDLNVDIDMCEINIKSIKELGVVLDKQFDCLYMSEIVDKHKDIGFIPLKHSDLSIVIPIDSSLSKRDYLNKNDLKDQIIAIAGNLHYSAIESFVEDFKATEICEFIQLPGKSGIELYQYCVKNNYLLLVTDDYSDMYPFVKSLEYVPKIKNSRGIYYLKSNEKKIKKFVSEYSKARILGSYNNT